jgi:hypothetical protein
MEGSGEAKRAADAAAIAAIAAVLRYLALRAGPEGRAPAQALGAPRPWAQYGRRALMDQRLRMQARRRA